MSESFSVGDLVEVVQTDPFPKVQLGDRGQVIGTGFEGYWGETFVHVDYGHRRLYSRTDSIRKIPAPQDWVTLCKLDEVKHEEPAYV